MAKREARALLQIAERAAEQLCTNQGSKSLFATILSELHHAAPDESAYTSLWARTAGCVGIWQPGEKTGEFVRVADFSHEWAKWAKCPKITSKGNKRRVALVGESAPRGFLYDPQYTPAGTLGSMLNSYAGIGEVEIVDLACTGLLSWDLLPLVHSTADLLPDIVVIFAGNNWNQHWPPATPHERRITAEVLRDEGLRGLNAYFNEGLSALASGLVASFQAFTIETKIPVVLVVPETNLVDWRPADAVIPRLAGADSRVWQEYWLEARAALDDDKVDDAAAYAEKMIELDEGLSEPSLGILGECKQRQGDMAKARRCFELARDSSIGDFSRAPSAFSTSTEILRAAFAKGDIIVVDLPAVFQEWLDGELPDRRLFLDYCHLSSEGIRVAMAATAGAIAKKWNVTEIPRKRLYEAAPGPANTVEATVQLRAAIHNARRGQCKDIVRFHCEQALRASSEIAGPMQSFIQMQASRAPMWACKEILDLCTDNKGIGRYLLEFVTMSAELSLKFFDRNLLDAMAESLEAHGHGALDSLANVRVSQYGVAPGKAINLLDPSYANGWDDKGWWEVAGGANMSIRRRRRPYYVAHSPVSRFIFMGSEPHDIALHVTLRSETSTKCVVAINGQTQDEIALTTDWKSHKLLVASDAIQRGLNEVTVRWETSKDAPGFSRSAAADVLENGYTPGLAHKFGDVFALTADMPSPRKQQRA